MTDLAWLTLEELAARIRSRSTSSEEVMRASLDRAERLEPKLNAFITLSRDDALSGAREADGRLASGRDVGPLHGVPLAAKDLFDVAGMRTTAGSAILRESVAAADSEVVARLRNAGMVVLGKTNLHEWAFGGTNQNPHYGPTRNPYDLTRIPGGSSGGSAVALAAGYCSAALGTDTGGSIRIPSALCGVVGLKPTYGRVSVRGVVPLSWNLDHAGPMARTVRDIALLYMAMAGEDRRDAGSAAVPLDDALAHIEDGVRRSRLAVPIGHFFERTEPEVADAVRNAIRVLEREGATVEEVPFPCADDLLPTQATILGADAAAVHRVHLRERPQDFGEDVLLRLRRGDRVTGPAYALARRTRDEILHAVLETLEPYDAMIVPTTVIPAPLAESADAITQAARLTQLTSPFNLTGLPAISVPCGWSSEGLPLGMQIVSAPWREATVLRVARAYERAARIERRRPPIAA